MSWNYRIVKKDGYLGIHEVYYYDSGEISGLTTEPVSPLREDLDDLRTTLEWMVESLQKPILDFEIFKAAPENDTKLVHRIAEEWQPETDNE